MKKLFTSLYLIVISTILGIANYYFEIPLYKFFLSLVIISASYLIFKVILEDVFSKRITGKKSRYTFKKVTSLLFIFVTLILVLRIWVPDTTTLVALYGFLAAAVGFAIQDIFKNFFGGIIILLKNTYRVGDRVTINKVTGDIIDIDIWYTYVLEIQEWVHGDQPTGRIVTIPNMDVISQAIYNYTDDHSFIWDEVHIPITYTSNWEKAETIIKSILIEYNKDISKTAYREINKLEEKYFLSTANIEANVFVNITDNWISLYGRYLTPVRERRPLNSKINRAILTAFEKESDIMIASESLTINNTK